MAPFESRLRWTQNLFQRSNFLVSDFERKFSQTVFAKDIFYHFGAVHPTSKFFWILGEDQWKKLTYWKDIDTYAHQLEWLVLPRKTPHTTSQSLCSRRLSKLSCAYRNAKIRPLPEISSTKIRKCIEENKLNAKELRWVPSAIRKDVIETYRRRKEAH